MIKPIPLIIVFCSIIIICIVLLYGTCNCNEDYSSDKQNNQVKFDLILGDYNCYFIQAKFSNGKQIKLLIDTGSSPLVVTKSDYGEPKLKELNTSLCPNDPINYMGISASPLGCFVENISNIEVPMLLAKSDGFLPNILGLSKLYTPLSGNKYPISITDNPIVSNFSIDLSNKKFIINDNDNNYDDVFNQNKDFGSKFQTSFYILDLFIYNKKVPVLIDSGMSFGVFNKCSTAPSNALLKDEKGNIIFEIEPENQIEIAKLTTQYNQAAWLNDPFVILSNLSMTDYKFLFTNDQIKLRKIKSPSKLSINKKIKENIKNLINNKELNDFIQNRYR